MAQDFISIGVIGCGEHSREVLIPVLRANPHVRIVALCDPDGSNLSLAKAICLGATGFRSFEKLCAHPGIDAVFVVATPQVHHDAAMIALLYGKHVFVEKPMASNAELAEEMAIYSIKQGLVTMVGHNFRFCPAVERVKNVMSDQAFGKPLLAQLNFYASKPRGDRWELGSPERSFLLSHATHAIDIAVDLFPRRLSIKNVEMQRYKDVVSAHISMVSERESECIISVSNAAPHFDINLSIIGSKSSLIKMTSLREVQNFEDPEHSKRIGHVWVAPTLGSEFSQSGYHGEIKAFVHAIQTGDQCVPSFSDGLQVMKLVDEILSLATIVQDLR